MSRWVIAPHGLIEPVPALEIYCDGIGAIEHMGNGNLRFYLIAEQLPIEDGAAIIQRAVVAKIITGSAVVPQAIAQLAQCIGADAQIIAPPPPPPSSRPFRVK